MTLISPLGKKNNRSSLLSLENNYRHANGGAKLLTIRKLKSVYTYMMRLLCGRELYSNYPVSLRFGHITVRNLNLTTRFTDTTFMTFTPLISPSCGQACHNPVYSIIYCIIYSNTKQKFMMNLL